MSTVTVKCSCGKVKGEASNVTPSSGNRVICCCSDCQDFAKYLTEKGGASFLDEFGGTEIFQLSQAQVTIHEGQEHLQAMRLTKKGLLRWYTSCCNSPVANTINAKMPFAGIVHSFMDLPDPEAVMGPIKAVVQTQHALGTPTYTKHSAKFPLGITASIVKKMLVWKIQGKNKPSPFFSDDGRPSVKPLIVSEQS